MAEFPLKIVTPDGLRYDGMAEKLVIRTSGGDAAILPGHIPYVAPLGMGEAMVVMDGSARYGACIGGMVTVMDGRTTLVAASFEWAESIDSERAKRSEERANAVLSASACDETERKLAQARRKRALIRQRVAVRKSQ